MYKKCLLYISLVCSLILGPLFAQGYPPEQYGYDNQAPYQYDPYSSLNPLYYRNYQDYLSQNPYLYVQPYPYTYYTPYYYYYGPGYGYGWGGNGYYNYGHRGHYHNHGFHGHPGARMGPHGGFHGGMHGGMHGGGHHR